MIRIHVSRSESDWGNFFDMTAQKTINVLFLCTGNSARSILCETALNTMGKGRFKGFSAGSQPKDEVHPMTLKTLDKFGISAEDCRSKSWDEFSDASAPIMDIVVTVCDNAAAEVCPVWPASPVTAHWSIPDPAAVGGPSAEQEQAFEQAWQTARHAVSELVKTVSEEPDSAELSKRLNAVSIASH